MHLMAGVLFVALLLATELPQSGFGAQPHAVTNGADSAPRVVTSVPSEISDTDLNRYCVMLTLAEPQEIFLKQLYGQYQERFKEITERDAKVIDSLSLQTGAALGIGRGPAAAALFQELDQAQSSFRKQVENLDSDLFNQTASMLSETQLEKLDRVKDHRKRARCFPLYTLVMPARIDLSAIVEQANLEEDVLQAADPILMEYEVRATRLFVQLREAVDKNGVDLEVAFARNLFDVNGKQLLEESPQLKAGLQAYLEQVKRSQSHLARVSKQLAELNDSFISRIREAMPEKQGTAIENEYRRRAYQDVYPDPTDPKPVYDLIVKWGEFTAEEAEIFEAIWHTYRNSYDTKCKLMAEASIDYRLELERTLVSTGGGEYAENMQKWRQERWTLNENVLGQILEAFPHRLPDNVRSRIAEQYGLLETFRFLGASDRYPG